MKYVNCPNCGGKIHFDVGLQKIKCEYCDSVFDPEEIGDLVGAVEDTIPTMQEEEEVTVFSCPSCGAEVTGEDVSAVEYCQYCGSFVTFNSRIEKIRRPDIIAPFEITKERCKEIYQERIKGTLYVPNDLKRAEGKIEFHPMFIPFWNMEVEFPGNNKVSANEEWRDGNYDCSRRYDIEFETEGKITNCFFDASRALDDNISDCIGDYEPEKLVDYNPSYMHGAFADMADVEAKTYEEEAKRRCFITLSDGIRDAVGGSGLGVQFHDSESMNIGDSSEVEPKVSAKLSMFPVWFMTLKNKDRVAYSVVNGQTGSIFTETPIDLVKFFIASILMAVPIFFVLEALATFRPATMLGIVSVMTAIVLIMYSVIAGREWDRDRRKLGGSVEADYRPASRFRKLLIGIVVVYLILFFISVVFWIEDSTPVLGGIRIIALIASLIAISSQYEKYDKPAKRMLIRETFLGLLGIFITIVFMFYDPVFDWYYYAAAIVAMIGMLISIFFVLKRYNRRVTHPVPHFFNGREGGILAVALIVLSLFAQGTTAFAQGEVTGAFYAEDCWQYINPQTGYSAYVWDDAELLTDEEEEWLINDMIPITEFGYAVFSSDYQDTYDTDHWSEEVLRLVCDKGESGTIFEIDMTNRQIFIYSDGEIYKTVTKSYANTITDNVYRYATDGRFYDCAAEAFGQMFSLLGGKSIAQPMKHINNSLLAIALGILINFIILNILKKKNDKNAAQNAISFNGNIVNLNVIPGVLHRVYNPPKSSSGGGRSGGGGGGGRSGGGGGHSF